MNENVNLCEMLKDCPKGTKLYSLIHGEVKFQRIEENTDFPIMALSYTGEEALFDSKGRYFNEYDDAECILFPSKDCHTWKGWKCPKKKIERFNPRTLKPFDKILTKPFMGNWTCNLFSHINGKGLCVISGGSGEPHTIPYNNDTKHLIGTTDEAPEYYRYWED